mmetsp:Transcript_17185/g.23883  ORF Transcript_17185/g.23883 Transcript_17185/m.23883 type:complete len:184 (-) Transcript_17185:317-868(-)
MEQIQAVLNHLDLRLSPNEYTSVTSKFWNEDLLKLTLRDGYIPKPVFGCSELVELWLSNSHITKLSKKISRLHNLKRLYLDRNLLQEFPKSILSLTKLQCFDISHNLMIELPMTLRKLTSLRRLVISGNPLQIPPQELHDCPDQPSIVLEYLQAAAGGMIDSRRVKIVLFGDARAGKVTQAEG